MKSIFFILLLLVPLASWSGTQNINPSTNNISALPNENIEFDVVYSSDDETLTGLGVKLFFDSSKLDFVTISNTYSDSSLAIDSSPSDDTSDEDNNTSTDKFINAAWLSIPGTWPGVGKTPLRLYTITFKLKSDFTNSTTIGFTGNSAAGQTFSSTNLTVTKTEKYTLSVNPSSNGKIVSNPAGIDCGSDCSEQYVKDTGVTLTAIPDEGYQVASWSGDCSGSNTTCNLTLSADKAASVTFELIPVRQYSLSISNVPANGSVSSNPSGINCGTRGSDCSANYDENTQVTLTAIPDNGYEIASWGGDCSGSSNTCILQVSANQTASITFREIPPTTYTLSVNPSSNGKIVSNPAGIDCGSDCSEQYVKDTSVTLTAIPDEGYQVASWSGDCSGSITTCNLTLSADKAASVTFELIPVRQYSLSISNVPTNGNVSSNPSGINCGTRGSDCSANYDENTQVTLTAIPDNGYEIASWGGDCSSETSTRCRLTISKNRNTSVTFIENQKVIPIAILNMLLGIQ